jgi:uncharacterized SAM-binding protein YcdF (DUF218 family)
MDSLSWHLTNVISNLILPPTVFFVLITIGLWQGQKKPWGRWLVYSSVTAFALFSLPAVGYWLVKPFEETWPPLDFAKAGAMVPKDAVVVILGGGRTFGAIEYPEQETLSEITLKRCRYGAALAERLGLPLSVTGGKPGGGQQSEAELMRDFLEEELKHSVAFIEDKSSDTRQNALFTAMRMEHLKVGTIILVTDVWHMPRAQRAFESAGLKVIPAPMGFRSGTPLKVTDWLPSAEGLRLSGRVLHELVGEMWYGASRWVSTPWRTDYLDPNLRPYRAAGVS